MKIDFIHCHGRDLIPYLDELAKLRITVFREFPYLYAGTSDYEKDYLKTYVNSPRSLVVLARSVDGIIGATTCIPMEDETPEFTKVYQQTEIEISKVFYFGESIILPSFRGQKIGHEFFKLREEYALATIPELEWTTFCAVDRPVDHPLRPRNYRSLDEFWIRMGYAKDPKLKVYFPWQDINKDKEDNKAMSVWLKNWKK